MDLHCACLEVAWGGAREPRETYQRSCSCVTPGSMQGILQVPHLIFTTSKRGWYYHSCFPVNVTEAQKEQRILYKVTELVSDRGRTWISSLSQWLPAVINVVSQQYHIVRKTSFKYLRLQTSLGWVQMTSKFKTLILKTQSSSLLAFWTFPLVHPSQRVNSSNYLSSQTEDLAHASCHCPVFSVVHLPTSQFEFI